MVGINLEYLEEGVFLSCEDDISMSFDDLYIYLQKKKIQDFDEFAVRTAYFRKERIQIAPVQEEGYMDDYINVRISLDKLKCYIKVITEDEQGKRLTKKDVLDILTQDYHITYGINELSIEDALDSREETLVASSKTPKDGVDAKIEISKNTIGKCVEKGTVVAIRKFSTDGIDGVDVFGDVLSAKKGQEISFKYGENLEEEGDKLVALTSGTVLMNSGKLYIENSKTINEVNEDDVIDFEGSLLIECDVPNGVTIHAGGSVTVIGNVKSAFIYSNADIIINGSFKPVGKGMLKAKGNIKVSSCEFAVIKAKDTAEIDTAYDSNIMAYDKVIINQAVVGGNIYADFKVIIGECGSNGRLKTCVTVGESGGLDRRKKVLSNELESLKELINQQEMIKNRKDLQGKVKLEIIRSLVKAHTKYKEYTDEYNQVDDRIKALKRSEVEVKNTIYPECVIVVNNKTYYNESMHKNVKFICINDQVVVN